VGDKKQQAAENKVTMESSRIFVKNLPPTIDEAEFRKHFSAQGREVTDIKLIPSRRIGFVGYKSHDDAAKAVKYFNRSFIRMSRIGVDLAKPVSPPPAPTNTPGLLLIIDARLQTQPLGCQPRRMPHTMALPGRLAPSLVLPV
jgi:RNA recognition motif-containing protein